MKSKNQIFYFYLFQKTNKIIANAMIERMKEIIDSLKIIVTIFYFNNTDARDSKWKI